MIWTLQLCMTHTGPMLVCGYDEFVLVVGDVDQMNELLRDQFVKLYSQPILENFLESLQIRYPDVSFPPIPEKGKLDLNCVRESPYFFN